MTTWKWHLISNITLLEWMQILVLLDLNGSFTFPHVMSCPKCTSWIFFSHKSNIFSWTFDLYVSRHIYYQLKRVQRFYLELTYGSVSSLWSNAKLIFSDGYLSTRSINRSIFIEEWGYSGHWTCGSACWSVLDI